MTTMPRRCAAERVIAGRNSVTNRPIRRHGSPLLLGRTILLAAVLLTVACLLAEAVPTRLADY